MKNPVKMRALFPFIVASIMISCKKEAVQNDPADTFKMKAGNAVSLHPPGLQTNLRVYGYMETWGASFVDNLANINLDQLTDLCISFINPNSSGVFNVGQDIIDAVPVAHAAGVRVHYSIGGGGGPAYWDNLIAPANRASVISNMMKVLNDYGFDGIDVDLEGARISNNPGNYNAFVSQLADSVHSYSKLVSIAIARYQYNLVWQGTYDKLDFLNAMIYDYTTTYPRSHSPFSSFQNDFNTFKTRIPASKINLGIPCYAWEYVGNTRTTQVSLKTIIAQYPGALALNYKNGPDGKSWYYDGFPEVRRKVAYSLQNGAGGMMIWQMMHDTKDEAQSLVKLLNYCAAHPENMGFDPTVSYGFTSGASWLPIEVAGASLADWAGIQQNTAANGNHQLWNIVPGVSDFKAVNKNSGKVLDEIDETASGKGLQFAQNTWHGGGNQRYWLIQDDLGYYKVKNIASSRLLTVNGNSMLPGAAIIQWPDENTWNQKWMIWRK